MSGFLRDEYQASSTIKAFWSSYNGAGASVTVTSYTASTVKIYKDGSTTERSSSNGITATTDFDSRTGMQYVAIDLSDNTDAGFYAVGSQYTVQVIGVTIDSQTVNLIVGTFRIVPAEGVTGKPKVDVDAWLGTAASTPTVAGVPNVNAKTWNDLATVALPLVPTTAGRTLDVSAGGEAGLDWANVGSPTTAVDLSATTIKTTQKVDVDTIKTNPVVNGGTATFPTNATLASTTNITAASGVALSAAGIQAIWDALTSALTAVGSIGKLLVDNINATISSRLATSGYTAPDNSSITAIKAKTDSLTFTVAGKADSNVKYVNDTQVTGTGASGDEWGPV